MTSRTTKLLTAGGVWLVLTFGLYAAELPANLDDDYSSENKSTRLHGRSTETTADQARKRLSLTTPVAGVPNALDARDTDALKAVAGQLVTVEGVITSTYHSKKSDTRFFNFTKERGGFSFVIFSSAVKSFEAVGDPLEFYKQKKVQVTGVLTIHQGRPSMVVSKSEQLVLVR
jgi:hypothetical protein